MWKLLVCRNSIKCMIRNRCLFLPFNSHNIQHHHPQRSLNTHNIQHHHPQRSLNTHNIQHHHPQHSLNTYNIQHHHPQLFRWRLHMISVNFRMWCEFTVAFPRVVSGKNSAPWDRSRATFISAHVSARWQLSSK